MNTADKSLCEELFKISGWIGTENMWHFYGTFDDEMVASAVRGQGFNVTPDRFPQISNTYETDRFIAPAYDLGYLIRKLPKVQLHGLGVRWSAQNGMYGNSYTADTPENALCKLSIELWKQGILTRGDVS